MHLKCLQRASKGGRMQLWYIRLFNVAPQAQIFWSKQYKSRRFIVGFDYKVRIEEETAFEYLLGCVVENSLPSGGRQNITQPCGLRSSRRRTMFSWGVTYTKKCSKIDGFGIFGKISRLRRWKKVHIRAFFLPKWRHFFIYKNIYNGQKKWVTDVWYIYIYI